VFVYQISAYEADLHTGGLTFTLSHFDMTVISCGIFVCIADTFFGSRWPPLANQLPRSLLFSLVCKDNT